GVFAGVLVAAAVSFAVGSVLLGFGRLAGDPDDEEPEAVAAEAGEEPAPATTTRTDEAPATETAPHGA
ncbi:MAG: hypothetical protein JWP48_5684, partial [Actinoallomurus sp.]|nr:hypothetical protein [Actinoallomurus sp.]